MSQLKCSLKATQINVFGTIAVSGKGIALNTSYSIDNGPPEFFAGTQGSVTQYQQLFFQSKQLSPSEHTLKITNLVPEGQFYLDFLNISGLAIATAMEPLEQTATSLSRSIVVFPSIGTHTVKF